MNRSLLALSALLMGGVSAQAAAPQQDNPFTSVVRTARQVIVYAPRLSDPRLVNALKVGANLGVPMRVLTTDDGLMQENGLILRLVVLGVPVYRVAQGGDRRMFLEVESAQGWNVYDFSAGDPDKARMFDFNAFNRWYGANARTLPQFNPERSVGLWAKAHLGYNLTYTSVKMLPPKTANSGAAFVDALRTPPQAPR